MTLASCWIGDTPALQTLDQKPSKIIILQPLFEEANRFRRTLALLVRCLEQADIQAIVPDLPGMGEHPVGLDRAMLADIQRALTEIAEAVLQSGSLIGSASFRGACLFDQWAGATNRWRFAPEDGDRLVRTLMRTEDPSQSSATHAFVSGQYVSRAFLAELGALNVPHDIPQRTVRLASDKSPADLQVEASPLWRHAEPGEDASLARVLAEDIIAWSETCVDF